MVTYSDGGEYILELVDECNQPRIVYVDTVGLSVLLIARGCPKHVCAYALGFAAMVGDLWIVLFRRLL